MFLIIFSFSFICSFQRLSLCVWRISLHSFSFLFMISSFPIQSNARTQNHPRIIHYWFSTTFYLIRFLRDCPVGVHSATLCVFLRPVQRASWLCLNEEGTYGVNNKQLEGSIRRRVKYRLRNEDNLNFGYERWFGVYTLVYKKPSKYN